jgi:hypothetical protein
VVYNPQGFKSDYIKYQVFKQDDKAHIGGYSRIRNITKKLNNKNYYIDYFNGACDVYVDANTDTYKNIFKIYTSESVIFSTNRYLKTNNGSGRKIALNITYINANYEMNPKYRFIVVEGVSEDKYGDVGYDISVSSTYQVEILDLFKPKYGVFSWFPIKDFDFDINYSTYAQYVAFADECKLLQKKLRDNKSNKSSEDENTYYSGIIEGLAKSPFSDDSGNFFDTEYDYYFEQIHPDLCLMSKTTPYISKWGYYDEQKDSCENPYRLNVSKIFGVSNLSSNIYLRECDENEYTHSMPYYMVFGSPNYYKEYQYIASDEIYRNYNDESKKETSSVNTEDTNTTFETFIDCVEYWINMFSRTDIDKFSEFFSGKKYGNRFDRKYSRLMGGDRFHNPSTLFRGVKFEVVRQFNGVDKRSSEYNDYKFSFIYIPVTINSLVFNSTVYFVKNDTFKFIVGIVFVNTMLGVYNHNVFNGAVDYFNKGFLYAACKDMINIKSLNDNSFDLTLICQNDYTDSDSDCVEVEIKGVENSVFNNNYEIYNDDNIFYLWVSYNSGKIIVTKTRSARTFSDIIDVIGEIELSNGDSDSEINNGDSDFEINNDIIKNAIKDIKSPIGKYTLLNNMGDNYFYASCSYYYENYETIVYTDDDFYYYGSVKCVLNIPDIEFKNISFIDVCDNIVESDDTNFGGYKIDISELYFKSKSIRNILINIGDENAVYSIKFYDENDENKGDSGINKSFINGSAGEKIKVDINTGNIVISDSNRTLLVSDGSNGKVIEKLKMDIVIKNQFDAKLESLALKNYFSVFEQLSSHNIAESINNDYNVSYYSTTEDNKYKIRVIEPDSIEVEDKYEAIPVKITHKNNNVFGSVEIKEKMDIDKIGIKVINRYSGFYNPIFNDILYYNDYTYNTTVERLRNVIKFELPYSNTNINYNYSDAYGDFGIIKNMYYHKTNIYRSDQILTSDEHVYPAINEYALDYRDYNIFSSNWDEGYFISQDDLDFRSICDGIGSMKDGLCMFGSKYLNLPDQIFIDTFKNGKEWDERLSVDIRDNTEIEIMYREIDNRTVVYKLFIEKRLKRYLREALFEIFSKYINKNYSFGNKGTIEDDIDEYVEKNLLRLYKVDRVYMYIKDERMDGNNRKIENEYLMYMNKNNEFKIKQGFPVIPVNDGVMLKGSNFIMKKTNEFDRDVTYNLKNGFKESFGFGVSFRRK